MSGLLVFGLGNPGKEYENTYHNVGKQTLVYLQNILEKERQAQSTSQDEFIYRKYGHLILAWANPAFFMNESGVPIRQALAYFKLKPERLIVLHDDSDLNVGEMKLELGRGAAGHRGVESVIEALGTNGFWRGRIGIRPPVEKHRQKAEEFVLKKIRVEDEAALRGVFETLGAEIRSAKFAA